MTTAPLPTTSFRASDVVRAAACGLVANRLRAVLSALGIAIGIASMVAVLGITASSQARLLATLDRLGTNLLTVAPGTGFLGDDVALPDTAVAMVERIAPVQSTNSVTNVDAAVYRNDLIPANETNGLSARAVDLDLLDLLNGDLATGRDLATAPADLPVTVLGATAAQRLGIGHTGVQVVIGGEPFAVVGIAAPLELAPELDSAALIGRPVAEHLFAAPSSASTLYVRADPEDIDAVNGVLPATVNPENPEAVEVTRPSDALAARDATQDTFTGLLLGLGAVALVVGGLGIANVMVIAVLERRNEIGLRRALGATRRHVARQFLSEAILLSVCGGVGGALLGAAVIIVAASRRGWPVALSPQLPLYGVAAAVAIGAVAGVYPAMRAARLSPTDALNH